MAEFRCLSELELDQLGDDEIVAYVAAAREAGCDEAGRSAMGILAFRREPQIAARVALKIPVADIDDVVMEVIESVLRSAFDGKVIGQYVNFLNRITSRRIADYHRKRENDPGQDPLPSEHEGEEEFWGEQPAVEDAADEVALRDVIERVLEGRSELHRRIIELYGPDGIGEDLTAAGVVERMAVDGETVTEANVQQVWHRFKKDLDTELAKGEDGGTPDV